MQGSFPTTTVQLLASAPTVVSQLRAHHSVLQREIEQIAGDINAVRGMRARYAGVVAAPTPGNHTSARGGPPGSARKQRAVAAAAASLAEDDISGGGGASSEFLTSTLSFLEGALEEKVALVRRVEEQLADVEAAISHSSRLASDVSHHYATSPHQHHQHYVMMPPPPMMPSPQNYGGGGHYIQNASYTAGAATASSSTPPITFEQPQLLVGGATPSPSRSSRWPVVTVAENTSSSALPATVNVKSVALAQRRS